MDFIERVEKDNMDFFVRIFFEKIWEQFDVDKDNVLNQKEFTNLIRSVTGKKIKKKDANAFLSYLDTNGNKLADKNEIINFVLQGMKVEKSKRKVWKLRSKLHGILMGFIEKVELSIFEK